MNKLSGLFTILGFTSIIFLPAYAESGYKLPFSYGELVKITTGNNSYPHTTVAQENYAWDMVSGVDSNIVAAMSGRIVYIKKDGVSYPNGSNCVTEKKKYANDANYIVIEHDNGEQSLYLHLKENSITINLNDQVKQGQIIGKIGNTGWSCGTHLHFQVQSIGNSWFSYSKSIAFDDVMQDNGIPLEGYSYVSANTSLPSFHGAGSLISSSENGYGFNYDFDAIHELPSPNPTTGLILFQWYRDKNCASLDLNVSAPPNTSTSSNSSVEIRTGNWNERFSDRVYDTYLPTNIQGNKQINGSATGWNVTAVKINNPSKFPKFDGVNRRIVASCSSQNSEQQPSTKNVDPNGILLSNGYYWQGNGSLITDSVIRKTIGSKQDTVNLISANGAAFFQWKKTSVCKKLGIVSTYSGAYKVRFRAWNDVNNIISKDINLIGTYNNKDAIPDWKYQSIDESLPSVNDGYYLLSVYGDKNVLMQSTPNYAENKINVKCIQ